MPRPNVLVIAVDGLRASALGSYGNTWYRTPTLDRLATQSILCDWCFADTPELSLIYRGLWQSTSALRPTSSGDSHWSLPATLAELGYYSRLITDADELGDFTVTQHFADAVLLENQPALDVREAEQTCAAGVLAEVLEFLEGERTQQQPWFVWTHLKGLYGTWDAPHELALSLVEEEDTAPDISTDMPNRRVDRTMHADEIFAHSCRYAGQVMSLDSLLAPLCDMIESGVAGECILVLLGTRGFPLGEHGQFGGIDDRLFSEQLQVPLLVRLPQRRGALSRKTCLIAPADLPTTILAAVEPSLQLPSDGRDFTSDVKAPWRSSLLAASSERTLSIRTPAWYLRLGLELPIQATENGPEAVLELYVKPDDRWEANDIASRCPEIVAELAEIARAERDRFHAGEPVSRAVLARSLVEPMS